MGVQELVPPRLLPPRRLQRGACRRGPPAEEAGKLVNRTIGVTLFDITKDLSHLTIKLTFQIDRVEGDKAFTRFKEMELARDYIRSLVRRGGPAR